MNRKYNEYKKVDVNTTNRGKIVVMLYGGAITFLKKAVQNVESKNYAEKMKYLNKAEAIIDELNYSLDMKKGKEISKNLRNLYLFCKRHLSKGNIKNDVNCFKEVIDILENLKTAFEEILQKNNSKELESVNKKGIVRNSIKRYV